MTNNKWYLYGKTYNLINFLDKHPGGRTILELTKNEDDITATFESYHSLANLRNIKKTLEKYKISNNGKKRLSQKATLAALFIELYRDEPILQLPHKLLNQLVDMDQLWTSWRNRHSLLVYRMIGNKIGTGGSAGHKYLNKTAQNHTIFNDISNLSTYIIPRSSLPLLPDKLKMKLGFYFTYGE